MADLVNVRQIKYHPLFRPRREFRRVYNYERPHEAFNDETPGSFYAPSTRLLPRYTKAYVYPAHFQTRRVNDAGDISWHKNRVFVSEVFRGEDIGLERLKTTSTKSTSAILK